MSIFPCHSYYLLTPATLSTPTMSEPTLPSPTEREAMTKLAQSLVAQAKELQSYIEKYGDCDRTREAWSIVPDMSSIAPSPADTFLDTDNGDRDTHSPSANSTLNLIRNMHNMPSPFETYSESQYCLDAAIICEITARLKGDATGLHKIVSLVLHNDDVHTACEILLECTEDKACKLLHQAQSVLGQAHHAASDPVSFSRLLTRFRHGPLEHPGDSEGETDTEDHQLPLSYIFDMNDFDYLDRGSFASPRSLKMTSLLATYPDNKFLQYIAVPVFCHCKL